MHDFSMKLACNHILCIRYWNRAGDKLQQIVDSTSLFSEGPDEYKAGANEAYGAFLDICGGPGTALSILRVIIPSLHVRCILAAITGEISE